MASPPSFSSFPDLPVEKLGKVEAGPSQNPAPSFSSFPELEPQARKRRSRSRSKGQVRDDDDQRRQKMGRERTGDKERDRGSRKRKEKDEVRVRDERQGEKDREARQSGERKHEGDRKGRRRNREEDEGRRYGEKKKRKDERDHSAERRYKEERRERERKQAEALIRGDVRISQPTVAAEKPTWKEDGWVKEEDGVPWYETLGKTSKKKRYEDFDDPNSSSTFFVDIAGDRDILRYGGSSSFSAPKYHRDGGNRIIGYNDGLRIVYSRDRTEKGIEVAPKGRPYVPRYNKQTKSAIGHLERILLRPSPHGEIDSHANFLAFEVRSRQEESDVPKYRSITRSAEEDKGDQLSVLHSIIGDFTTMEQEVRKRTSWMEQHLRDYPSDVERWIEYSRLHLKLSPNAERATGIADPAKLPTTKAQAEITLSILSRALKATPENAYSERLHLAYLRAAETVWSADKVTSRWKNVLRGLGEQSGKIRGLEEGMMEMWLGYIEWREGQGFGRGDGEKGKGESIDEVVDVYLECIDRLKNKTGNGGNLQAREENLVYLFLRACLFLKQSGHGERALSAFQALMEITFFKPDHLRYSPPADQLTAWYQALIGEFETFWDTEAPRIGEPGSVGWRNTPAGTAPPPSRPAPSFAHTSFDPFERWFEAEISAEKAYALPGRVRDLDPAIEDDPFHVIVFSDISPFLFPIFTPEVRLQLIYAFLTFLGLPFTPPEVPSASPANADPHLCWALVENRSARQAFWPPKQGTKKIAWQTVGGEPMEPERMRGMDDPFGCPVKCWAQNRETMFGRKGIWYRDVGALDLQAIDVELVRSVFELLRPLVPDPSFTLASFALEAAISPKGAVKAAKAILASERSNLLLWDGYARIERQRGNISASRTVYATALQAARQERGDKPRSEDEMDLWAGWAEVEFEADERERCLEVLIMAAGIGSERLVEHINPTYTPTAPSPINVLKSRQYYHSVLTPLSPSHLLLIALFNYLLDGIDSARDLLLHSSQTYPSSSAGSEESLQLLTKILYHHTTRHPTPPALTRDILEYALSSFPNNTSFLSLYMYGELGGRVYGRVQRLIAEITSEHKDGGPMKGIVGHLWAVWAEAVSAHRTFWDDGGGGAERVRMALDKGINSTSGRYSAALWMLYIEFEALMGRHQTAKQLCYRAVSMLGGCKALYLLPFSLPLRSHFSTHELKGWAELMVERGLRLRIPFELFWTTEEVEENEVSRTPLPLRTEPKGGLLDPNEICGRRRSNEFYED
ncbi:hypothetical protein C359_05015 [Cryptococcus neoformans Bt120]|nr:hypothetical protein C360_06677 [Cryptococcus neoformans var. grubii Bt15]OXG37638.1 hypothetical protein C359_05015 [Cryptococcus neoformans var. grubii Bt120]